MLVVVRGLLIEGLTGGSRNSGGSEGNDIEPRDLKMLTSHHL